MQRITTGYHDNGKPIDADLYRLYSETLRKAVSLGGIDPDLRDQWLANVSRFAVYKAARATQQVAETVIEHGGDLGSGIAPLRAHKRYLAAEANTARTRARTGKQWQQFNEDDHLRLFPNLRWVPSRSATPREAHQIFWGKVWAKDDPFWQHNQPGTLWNCKCDWEETDDPVTSGNPAKNIEVPGLKGNPATTGKIFSDDAPYIARAAADTEKICRKTTRNDIAKQGREINRDKHITREIDGTEHEFDFNHFKIGRDKADICFHYAASMFGNDNYWLKNEILLCPQPYLDKARLICSAPVDDHNTGSATIALKNATDRFFYFETALANGEKIILHVGRYRETQKLYLYAASTELPEYVRSSR